ncbi:MAG: N-formylglutamate amidohydrolase [Phycisphaerales bacterium]|nr:MAG: N-formylglutamate amidohydrolase [Phycisphaerales bacterium]
MAEKIWRLHLGGGQLVATAIHDGHELRPEVAKVMALSDAERLREEDPFTGRWTAIAPTRVVGTRSRFEVDLNRAREKAVYRVPDDAWGLSVWKVKPSDGFVRRSLAEYDAFYASMRDLFTELTCAYGQFVVYDLHSYNHRRAGPDGPPADEQGHPQVNIGTGTMDRRRWAPVVDRFIAELGSFDFPGGRLDVRENVKFQGGNFVRWLHEAFPTSGCGLAIEVKKFFMDEWAGVQDEQLIVAIREALRATIPGVLEELSRL